MTTIAAIATGRGEVIFEGLRAEFGAIMAERILESEAADYLWETRLKERYLGQYIDTGMGETDDEEELSRVAILSFLGGKWHAASCLVNGEGSAVDLHWKRSFDDRQAAETAFDRAA